MYLPKNRKLQFVLAGAITTNEPVATAVYVDDPGSEPLGIEATANGVTAVDIVAAPNGRGRIRHILQLTVYNADTVAATVTLQIVNTVTNAVTILKKVAMTAGQTMVYTDAGGFQVA